MNTIILSIVGLLSGVCASLGIGGGFVLLLYLTLFANMAQREAQLLNLLFFLPIASVSILLHLRHKLIEKKVVLPAIIGGVAGVGLGVYGSTILSDEMLGKVFAVFILLIGLKELFYRPKPQASPYSASATDS